MTSIDIHEDVLQALKENKAVVALESTIISHGMPYPDNVEMAKSVEAMVRKHGAVPATIAVLDGKVKVGLTHDEIVTLGKSQNVLKASKRDLAYAISHNLHAGTTVSATMLIAERAGIKVFATGGIGGVHRNAEKTFDISRDLEEFADTNVAVVCAGAKAILDLSLTMEYLETKGVEVVGYKTDKLPAFYSSESEIDIPQRLDAPEEIAALMKTKWSFGLHGGIVIANPVPKDKEIAYDKMREVIHEALADAEQEGVHGKEVTPYLLAKVSEKTQGASLKANIALVLNNAALAARVAAAYAKLEREAK